MTQEALHISGDDWVDFSSSMSSLIQLSVGIMDVGQLQALSEESPFLVVVLASRNKKIS